MSIALSFILGFTTSFLGTIFPSMLNMSAVKTRIDKSNKEAIRFSFGVSVVVLVQAYIAIFFAKYIHDNPTFLENIKIVGVFTFAILSVYFLRQSKRERRQKDNDRKHFANSFMVGVMLSSLNMFAIPFFCETAAVLGMFGWLQFEETSIIVFVIGSAIGTFSLLNVYIMYAEKIRNKSVKVMKDMNLLLAGLTAMLALATVLTILL